MSILKKVCLEKIVTFLLAAVILVLVFIYADANIEHYTARMESDIASEALLASVLYDNGFVQPDTWYASTTIRVISTPNLAAFLYPVVGYDINLAMGISCTIMMLILLVVMALFCRQMKFSLTGILVALLLTLSFSSPADEWQKMIFLYASYYVSHIITMFIILMLYDKSVQKNKVTIPLLIVSVIIAVINGMQGLHASMFCYLPLLAFEILKRFIYWFRKRKHESVFILLWTVLLNFIVIVSSKATSATSVSTTRNIRNALPKFINEVCPSLYECLGFEVYPVLSAIILVASIIGFIVLIINWIGQTKDSTSNPVLLVFPIGAATCIFLTTFTTYEVAGRYYLMMLFSVAIGIGILVQKVKNIPAIVISFCIIGFGTASGFTFYNELIAGDNSDHEMNYEIVEWMRNNNYDYGYALFEYANCITIMGNNTVKVRAVSNMRDLDGCKWLTDTTWYPPAKDASGVTCYFVTGDQSTENFENFIRENNVNVLEQSVVGMYNIYILDHDYTVWEREQN